MGDSFLYNNSVIPDIKIPFIKLKGNIDVSIIGKSANDTGCLVNAGISTKKLKKHIAIAITTVAKLNPMTAVFLLLFLKYKSEAVKT